MGAARGGQKATEWGAATLPLPLGWHPFYPMDEESGFESRAEGRGVVSGGPGSDF